MKLGITDPTTGISVTVHDNDSVSIRIEGPGKCDYGTIAFHNVEEATTWVQSLDAMLKFVSKPFPPTGWTVTEGYAG
jgi:hypothetical protein